jgi:hypothetical protein
MAELALHRDPDNSPVAFDKDALVRILEEAY